MTYYREWSSKVQFRKGRMVDLPTLDRVMELHDPGYASVYMFREEDALKIKASGSSIGMNQYPVASKALIIDVDGGEEARVAAEARLKSLGIGYDLWFSGKKGYHIVIGHPLIESIDLPYSHLKAVEALEIECDASLYQHGRLISLAGRIHPETKLRKQWLYSVEGREIEIELVSPPFAEFKFESNGGLDELSAGLSRLTQMVLLSPHPGNRHTAIWGASKDLANAGLTYDTILELMIRTNELWPSPKTEEEVALAVHQAFTK